MKKHKQITKYYNLEQEKFNIKQRAKNLHWPKFQLRGFYAEISGRNLKTTYFTSISVISEKVRKFGQNSTMLIQNMVEFF